MPLHTASAKERSNRSDTAAPANWWAHWHLGYPLMWLGLWAWSGAHAQTVYRCGDTYGATASCAQGDVLTLPAGQQLSDPRSEQAQRALTTRTQREADALEAQRLRDEHQAKRVAAPATAWAPTAPVNSGWEQAPESRLMPRRGKAASPYFTAKDGSVKSKKTGPKKAKASDAASP